MNTTTWNRAELHPAGAMADDSNYWTTWVDYGYRHFDDLGAREAAKEILASRPGADPECHSN